EIVGARRRVIGEGVAPVAAPVDGVGFRVEKLVDFSAALVGIRIGDERLGFLGSGQFAGQIETHPAQESGIVGGGGQGGVLVERFGERRVNALGQLGGFAGLQA